MGKQNYAFAEGLQNARFYHFLGEDNKSTMEHISLFMAQCGKLSQNEYYKLQLFPLSLTRTAFTWFSSLPPNSIQN